MPVGRQTGAQARFLGVHNEKEAGGMAAVMGATMPSFAAVLNHGAAPQVSGASFAACPARLR